jgi:hypothetical protein
LSYPSLDIAFFCRFRIAAFPSCVDASVAGSYLPTDLYKIENRHFATSIYDLSLVCCLAQAPHSVISPATPQPKPSAFAFNSTSRQSLVAFCSLLADYPNHVRPRRRRPAPEFVWTQDEQVSARDVRVTEVPRNFGDFSATIRLREQANRHIGEELGHRS